MEGSYEPRNEIPVYRKYREIDEWFSDWQLLKKGLAPCS
jgi:hypothetical protein